MDRPCGQVCRHGIACLTGKGAVAIAAPKRGALSDGSTPAYDRLLLATGALPRQLPLAAGAGARCLTLRSFDDALPFDGIWGRASGSPLSAAASSGWSSRRAPQDAAQTSPHRGAAAGPDARRAGRDRRGCDRAPPRRRRRILCGAGIASITGDADEVASRLPTAESRRRPGVDRHRRTPVTALAETAGLRIENGIAVDGFLRTSDPDIYAAGDCCSFPLEIMAAGASG